MEKIACLLLFAFACMCILYAAVYQLLRRSKSAKVHLKAPFCQITVSFGDASHEA